MTDAELIRLAAEKVMGAPCVGPDASKRPLPSVPFCTQDDYGVRIWTNPPPMSRHSVFDPLANDADSAQILDKMAADGWEWQLDCKKHGEAGIAHKLREHPKGVYCAFRRWKKVHHLDSHKWYSSVDSDRKRAVVIAALRAVGVEVDE